MTDGSTTGDRPPTLAEVKIRAVVAALVRHGGCKVAAADELEVSLKTIYNLLHKGVLDGAVSREWVDGLAINRKANGHNRPHRSREWADGCLDRLAGYAADGLLSDSRGA
jgi:hypothetical protein